MQQNFNENEESTKISNLYEGENSKVNQIKYLKQFNYLFNMIIFGFGISLLILGMLFLTIYGYKYSFNNISVTLIASILIGISLLLIPMAVISNTNGLNRIIYLIIVLITFLLFILLLVFGVLALTNLTNDSLVDTVTSNMMNAFKKYDRSYSDSYQNKDVDYLQEEFGCCGVNSYTDWRTIFLYDNKYKVNDYSGQSLYNNLAFADYIPDSCCIDVKPNCAKKFSLGSSMNEPSRGEIVYIRGCRNLYLQRLLKDSKFLGILAICISIIGIILSSTQFIFSFVIQYKEKEYSI